MKSNPAKKTSEQCFLGKTKPTCQNSAIFEHFQKWPKNHLGDVLACGPSIVVVQRMTESFSNSFKLELTPVKVKLPLQKSQ